MADPTTTNIVLAVPTRGSDVGTWDVPLNGDMTIIDACFGSVTSKALTTGSVALSVTEAQVGVIRLTGTLTGNVAVTTPGIIKSWVVDNQCVVGSFYVTLGNASGGQVVGIPPGDPVTVFSDGTNMKYLSLGRVGSYIDYAGSGVPAWVSASTVPPYLNCDGTTFSSGTFPQLFAILGSTTLPDFRGRQRIFLNQGTGRVTTANGGVDGDTRFASGGNPSIPIAQSELPYVALNVAGTASVTSSNSDILRNPSGVQTGASLGTGFGIGSGSGGVSGYSIASTGIISGVTSVLGSGANHINMDPTCVGGITMIRAA